MFLRKFTTVFDFFILKFLVTIGEERHGVMVSSKCLFLAKRRDVPSRKAEENKIN